MFRDEGNDPYLKKSFLACYVISLPDALERRERCFAQLDGLLDYVIVDAIRGSLVAGDYPESFVLSPRIARKLVPAELGCSLSHKKALELFLNSKKDVCLIFEDDFALLPKFIPDLVALIEEVRQDDQLELIKIAGDAAMTAPGQLDRQISGFSLIKVVHFGVCAHGYIVNRRGAEKLVRTIMPIIEPYDIFLRDTHRHRCQVYETSPWLVGLSEQHINTSVINIERKHTRTYVHFTDWPRYFWKRGQILWKKACWEASNYGLKYILKMKKFPKFPV